MGLMLKFRFNRKIWQSLGKNYKLHEKIAGFKTLLNGGWQNLRAFRKWLENYNLLKCLFNSWICTCKYSKYCITEVAQLNIFM